MACLTDLYDTMRDITGQPKIDNGGEDSFSLVPAFKGKPKQPVPPLSVIRLAATSLSGRETGNFVSQRVAVDGVPRENEAKNKGLPPIQLFNLKQDKAEKNNLQSKNKTKVQELIELLDTEVKNGRSTAGKKVSNDREVTYLPNGYKSSNLK